MKFSPPLSIGTNTGASGASLAITVGAAGVPAGATIFVLVTEKSTSGTSGTLADTAGNTYSTITAGNLAGLAADGRGTLFAVTSCKALVNTNTITYTRNLSAASCAMSAFYLSGATGAATFTEALATATGTTGTITVTSGTLGAGRLVLGCLFASGTSTAGGNATFTNAASFVTPPVEANTTGSGGSRVDGGRLFKAASGTQVYNPTLSSTAQQWFLAVLGIIPPPDTVDLTEPEVARPQPQAKPFDPPNLLLTTLAPPPFVDNTKIFRAPIFARLPDPRPAARQEYVANLLPFQSMSTTGVPPPVTVDQPTGGARPKAAPFDPPNLLLTTLQSMSPVGVPPPVTVDQPTGPRPRGAIRFDPPNLLLTTLAPPPIVVVPYNIFRSPLFARLPDPRPTARQEYVANLLPLTAAPAVTVTFNQDDWPSATLPRTKAGEPAIGPSAPLYTPNPAQPFNQDLWDSATAAKAKATGEPIGRIAPLLTPNPATPFNQYEWRSTARVPLSLKSDVYFGAFALYSPNPPIPFNQDLWESAARAFPKAVGEAVAGVAPLYTPNPAQPFVQSDWFQIRSTQKAKVDDFVNLVPQQAVVVVTVTFNQDDWPNPTLPRPKIVDTSAAASAPLYRPNPAQPFVQLDWTRILTTSKTKVDDFVNLIPLYTVVIAPYIPGVPSDWSTIARAQPAQKSDVYGAPNPLLTPNPATPFNQDIWDSATPAKAKAYAEPIAASAPLYTPNPSRPFTQRDWPSATVVLKPAKVDTVELLLPIYAPNPARPFANPTETRTFAFQIVKSDIIVNLPLTTLAPPAGPPFSAIYGQTDWPSTAVRGPSDRSFALGINLPLITPPPPAAGPAVYAKPFFAGPGFLNVIPGEKPS